eukprot:1176197-Pyramimonas_sp.AAC.1
MPSLLHCDARSENFFNGVVQEEAPRSGPTVMPRYFAFPAMGRAHHNGALSESCARTVSRSPEERGTNIVLWTFSLSPEIRA